jgi:lipopolysaccharide transport system ATP-binding protein
MGDIAIRIEKLSKQYRIGRRQEAYKTLRDTLAEALMAPCRRFAELLRGEPMMGNRPDETMWALRDVSCEIGCGEVVGIIGRNGAGKSTLLKILARITEPTAGFADIHGRVGSLLEVGTGFHPELTGRENVYLYGAILGMKRAEIARKFDEIVAFAEVGKFVDTPVKHYSSGMYLRLAFAVAAHLETEILLVDEVLAVGDARFQKKCVNKMQEVSQRGRTVLFVSHDISAVMRLCPRVIMLEDGRVCADGPAHRVASAYLNGGLGTTAVREWVDAARAPAGSVARLCAVRVRTNEGQMADSIDIRQPVWIEMEYEVLRSDYVLSAVYDVRTAADVHAFSAVDLDPAWRRRPRPLGRYVSSACIPGNFLSEGTMLVTTSLAVMEPFTIQWTERDAVAFQVLDSMEGDSARGDWTDSWGGAVRPLLQWTTRFSPNGSHPAPLQTDGDHL